MKRPKTIRFRCYCFECDGNDKPAGDNGLRSDATEPDQDQPDTISGETDPHRMQEAIGKMLFGA